VASGHAPRGCGGAKHHTTRVQCIAIHRSTGRWSRVGTSVSGWPDARAEPMVGETKTSEHEPLALIYWLENHV